MKPLVVIVVIVLFSWLFSPSGHSVLFGRRVFLVIESSWSFSAPAWLNIFPFGPPCPRVPWVVCPPVRPRTPPHRNFSMSSSSQGFPYRCVPTDLTKNRPLRANPILQQECCQVLEVLCR
ncbi:hypothetical protein QBC43DRAFT_320881 [Cladorrhinum sp. PSN259]|nr:hypothetical protein QBC43DRAFT_320881 [Cladorrhinum sp. PSN259]